MIGKTLGHYEITDKLGQGGMGSVWLGQDSKLGRQVAIKTLPEEFAKDEERLARFEREAKLLASLNHPNIATIHGLEEHEGTRFLVLELVEGDTLADRLKRGAIPVEESLTLALQIAEALEAAHEKGVIHRDLKPTNIKVTPDGKVKVLDFGLAKAFAGDGSDVNLSQSPTLSLAATQQGVILGTAAYMSPEQARGQEVDKRADVWAFGCVLYEMLTGMQAFQGATVSDMLAAALKTEPDWSALPGETPSLIRRLLSRCVEKDRKRRIPDIGMARLEIDDVLVDPDRGDAPGSEAAVRQRTVMPWAITAGALVATAVMWLAVGRATTDAEVVRFTVQVEGGHEMFVGEALRLSLSPDGRTLAYVAQGVVHLRPLDRVESVVLEGTDGAESPFFSPDGLWIGFVRDDGLKKISSNGGPVLDITGGDEAVGRYAGASWARDGTIVYAKQGSRALWSVPATGGVSEEITSSDEGGPAPFRRWPQVLDGEGREVLYTRLPGRDWEDAQIVVEDFDSGELTIVVESAVYGRYVPSGHVLYVTGPGTALAVPFDFASRRVTGDAVPVASGVRVATFGGAASLAVSEGGTAAFVRGSNATRNILWWVNREGRRMRQLGNPLSIAYVNLSPDGRRLVVDNPTPGGGSIWLVDAATGVRDRFTFDDEFAFSPIWSPDGRRIAYVGYASEHEADGLFVRELGGGGASVPIHPAGPEAYLWLQSWSPDGNWLAFVETDAGQADVFVLRLDAEGRPVPVTRTSAEDWFPQFSPNGRWLAYQSNETDRPEIYVVSFPELDNKQQISTGGGLAPRWSPDGDELFFWTRDNTLMASRVSGEDALEREAPQPLFQELSMLTPYQYTVAPDAEQFLLSLENPDSPANEIHVVVNWFEELKRLAPASN